MDEYLFLAINLISSLALPEAAYDQITTNVKFNIF